MSGLTFGICCEQREAVHPRHVDVRDDHIDLRIGFQFLQRLYAVVCKDKLVATPPDLPTHTLQDQRLKVRFVVDNEDLVRHLCRTGRPTLARSGRELDFDG